MGDSGEFTWRTQKIPVFYDPVVDAMKIARRYDKKDLAGGYAFICWINIAGNSTNHILNVNAQVNDILAGEEDADY